jgi:hypothetical protein
MSHIFLVRRWNESVWSEEDTKKETREEGDSDSKAYRTCARARCLYFERLPQTEQGSVMVANRAGGEMQDSSGGWWTGEGGSGYGFAGFIFPEYRAHEGVWHQIVRPLVESPTGNTIAGWLCDHQQTELVHNSASPSRVEQLHTLPHTCSVHRKFKTRPQMK